MRIILLTLSLIFSLMPSRVFAREIDCGLKKVKVEFSAQSDAEIACEGIRRALLFFKTYGYSHSRQIHVRVLDHIILVPRTYYDGETEAVEVYANFDSVANCSNISSWEIDSVRQKKVFDSLPVSREYHVSFVAHEVAHALYHQIFSSREYEIERSMSEFVAYVVQIETLKEPDKSQVLELWPDLAFRSEIEIRSLTWEMAPHKFGIMSYRYYRESPGLMELILNGEVESGDKLMPLL